MNSWLDSRTAPFSFILLKSNFFFYVIKTILKMVQREMLSAAYRMLQSVVFIKNLSKTDSTFLQIKYFVSEQNGVISSSKFYRKLSKGISL